MPVERRGWCPGARSRTAAERQGSRAEEEGRSDCLECTSDNVLFCYALETGLQRNRMALSDGYGASRAGARQKHETRSGGPTTRTQAKPRTSIAGTLPPRERGEAEAPPTPEKGRWLRVFEGAGGRWRAAASRGADAEQHARTNASGTASPHDATESLEGAEADSCVSRSTDSGMFRRVPTFRTRLLAGRGKVAEVCFWGRAVPVHIVVSGRCQ